MKEHNDNDNKRTVSIQEPEITRERNEHDGAFQYKKDERYCTNSDFLIGWFVPRDTGLWRNNFLDVIIVV